MESATTNAMKQALAQALLDLLAVKPLEQITVQELANTCYIRRQTFYYHFSDLYALVDWILRQAQVSFAHSWDEYLCWQAYAVALLTHLDGQRERYQPLVSAVGFEYVFRLFQPDLEVFLNTVIGYYAPPSLSVNEREFLIFYHSKMLATLLARFLKQNFPYTPQELVGHLDTMMGDQVRGATLRYIGDT